MSESGRGVGEGRVAGASFYLSQLTSCKLINLSKKFQLPENATVEKELIVRR